MIFPLRNPARRPGRAGGFHLFLKFREIDFDQLAQLIERGLELLRRGGVLIDLRLRRTSGGHTLRADNAADAFANRRPQVHITLAQGLIAAQGAQDFVFAFLQRGRIVE